VLKNFNFAPKFSPSRVSALNFAFLEENKLYDTRRFFDNFPTADSPKPTNQDE